jgi:hypothetical protein
MTEPDRDEIRAEDHATLASIRTWLRMFAGGGFALVITGIWFAAQGWQQIERTEADVAELRETIAAVAARESARDVATSRLEERLSSMAQQLARIERALDRLNGGRE